MPPAMALDSRNDGAPLDERVLRTLAERSGRLAFNGLRRALAAHPETLTRSLRRLERIGTVGRDSRGYFLLDPTPTAARRPLSSTPIASVRLPPSTLPESVLGLLAGRWFGTLRWVGSYDSRGSPALVWSVLGVEGLLVMRVRQGLLKVVAELPNRTPVSPALAAAGDELLFHALSHLRSLAPEPPGAERGPAPYGAVALAAEHSAATRIGWAA